VLAYGLGEEGGRINGGRSRGRGRCRLGCWLCRSDLRHRRGGLRRCVHIGLACSAVGAEPCIVGQFMLAFDTSFHIIVDF